MVLFAKGLTTSLWLMILLFAEQRWRILSAHAWPPGPRKIVIVSSAPQIRYPDCYGIDMARIGDLVAFRAAIELQQPENNMGTSLMKYTNVVKNNLVWMRWKICTHDLSAIYRRTNQRENCAACSSGWLSGGSADYFSEDRRFTQRMSQPSWRLVFQWQLSDTRRKQEVSRALQITLKESAPGHIDLSGEAHFCKFL